MMILIAFCDNTHFSSPRKSVEIEKKKKNVARFSTTFLIEEGGGGGGSAGTVSASEQL